MNFVIFFILIKNVDGSIFDVNQVQNSILQLKSLFNFSEIGANSNGFFDLSDVKNKILQWKAQKFSAFCPTNGVRLQNLLNVACSSAQPTNTTARDACVTCFTRVTSMQEGPQELNRLSACATQYFTNTTYGTCATSLAGRNFMKVETLNNSFPLQALANSALNVQPSGCFMGYCDFARCLRRVNSINLITQCTREARTGVNIALDADNVRFYTNVTSCLLAKARCGSFNPITGEPQVPGYSLTGARLSNSLQFTETGEIRIIAFSMSIPVLSSFCSSPTNLTQNSWLANVC